MPSGLREARDLPPEGGPQFPPTGLRSITCHRRDPSRRHAMGPPGCKGSGESHREKAEYSILFPWAPAHAFALSLRPACCSRRLDAHGAEPRASGGPTARGMARVTSPHGVKPMGNGHGFPSLVPPPRGGLASWRGAARPLGWLSVCAVVPRGRSALHLYRTDSPEKSHLQKDFFIFFTF